MLVSRTPFAANLRIVRWELLVSSTSYITRPRSLLNVVNTKLRKFNIFLKIKEILEKMDILISVHDYIYHEYILLLPISVSGNNSY